MRQLILRAVTVVAMLVALLQAMPALAATVSPAHPGTTSQPAATIAGTHVATAGVVTSRLHPLKPRTRTDHELVVKSWANIRTAPTTVGNSPVGHFVWHSRFTALHRVVYGQHPYGPGSSNQWLKITSGHYRGDYVWARGIVDPHSARGPPAIAAVASISQLHQPAPETRRIHVSARGHRLAHHRTYRRHKARRSNAYRPYIGGGTLGCSGLEALWQAAGGASWAAYTAASIAMAESTGRQYAHSPTNDYGYWQINGSHGSGMATYNAYGNARAAVIISGNGTNWRPWATYTSGAYRGRC